MAVFAGDIGAEPEPYALLAIQKVVGSNPISRSEGRPPLVRARAVACGGAGGYGRSMSATAVDRPSSSTPRLLAVAALGAAVAISLGVYGNVHDPSKQLVFTLFFSTTISMKVWLATLALAFAVVQVLTALWVYGKISTEVPPWAGTVHRISGRLAFIISLPVAYHCLWSLGFQDTDTRVLVHSLLGCAFYGAFVAKVTIVHSKGLPGLALPIAGALMFSVFVALWLTSAYWFIHNAGWPSI
jgi:Family of unknown function (DUF6529)